MRGDRGRGAMVGVLCAAAVAASLVSCSESDGGGQAGADAEPPEARPLAAEQTDALTRALGRGRCDPIDSRTCLLPYPSDFYTQPADDTDTGLRVSFPEEAMPENSDGVVIDPEPYAGNDGFSPGTAVITYVPGLDPEASGISPVTDISASLEPDAPIVLLDSDTGERHPYWAEVDANAERARDRALIIRPAVNFAEGHRIVVGLRNLVDSAGEPIEARLGFRVYRDNLTTDLDVVEDRRDAMEQVFGDLAGDQVDRDDLYLAWDFTVASERSLTERMLHIRDAAFADLGDDAPGFEVTEVTDAPAEGTTRQVDGTFEVPSYLTGDGGPGTQFNVGDDGLPEASGETITAPFTCIIPDSVLPSGGGADPGRPVVYGHGLLGSHDEVEADNIAAMTDEHQMVYCATDWIGMAEDDIGNAAAILQELSQFPTLADRVQQGILNTLFLGRLMIHDGGLVSDEAFAGAAGDPVIDTAELFFDGNSQGAIIGGAATAVAQDWTRAVLGVPGMNYSTLLQRSVDFDTYEAILAPAYPSTLDQLVAISLIQMLWDRAETNGYVAHLGDDPLPDTPEKQVLLHVAFGDHQVAPVTADVFARTIGAALHLPAVAPGRSEDSEPYWGIAAIEDQSYAGSALVIWDSGTAAPPPTNLSPRDGHDPHEDPRHDTEARRQKSEFLRPDGVLLDVCEGRPCRAAPVD